MVRNMVRKLKFDFTTWIGELRLGTWLQNDFFICGSRCDPADFVALIVAFRVCIFCIRLKRLTLNGKSGFKVVSTQSKVK